MNVLNEKKEAAERIRQKTAELNAAINSAKKNGLNVDIKLLSSANSSHDLLEINVFEVIKF